MTDFHSEYKVSKLIGIGNYSRVNNQKFLFNLIVNILGLLRQKNDNEAAICD